MPGGDAVKRFAFGIALLLLVACDNPPRREPMRRQRLLVVGVFRGDTLVRIDGVDCHVSAVHGQVYSVGGVLQEAWYDARNATATCLALP
jgi:hypothetical protein